MECSENSQTNMKVIQGEAGYVLEDVPHLTDYLPDLPVSVSPSFFFFFSEFYFLFIYLYIISLGFD